MASRIELFVEPSIPQISWEEFRTKYAPYSIALDGYVYEGPRFDDEGPRANFNHHAEVSRLETRATCAQVLLNIRQGLFTRFRDENGARANVYVNDCDEDVCLSWFLLKHYYMAETPSSPILNKLVHLEDLLDTTAGTYPFHAGLPVLEELAWVFKPYRDFRQHGNLERKDAEEFESIITDVGHRIGQHLAGQGQSIALDTRYKRLGGGVGWALVEEVGAQSRLGLFSDGVRAFVSVRPKRSEGWFYSIGRTSRMIPFDVPAICQALNEAENKPEEPWGGGEIIIGSPRVSGSRLSPEEVARIVGEVVEGRNEDQPVAKDSPEVV